MHLAQVAQKRLPGVAEVSDTLGFIYYKKDLTSLAISTLKVSVERDPGNAMYQYHLGLAYAERRRRCTSEAVARASAHVAAGFQRCRRRAGKVGVSQGSLTRTVSRLLASDT